MNINKKNTNSFGGLTVGRITVLTFLGIFAILFILIFSFLNFYRPPINETDSHGYIDDIEIDHDFLENPGEESVPSTTSAPETKKERKKSAYTFLIAGRDILSSSTDVIMYIKLDVDDNTMSILQIPRDTYVENNFKTKRINAVFAYNYSSALKSKSREEAKLTGISALCASVKSTFGLPVDYYVLIDLSGFKALVDLVDGVDVYVPRKMEYSDPEQGLYIDIEKGQQTLYGEDAEGFIRYRDGYANGDIGRLDAQKIFLSALASKLIKFPISKINKLIELGNTYITTNMKTSYMISFATALLDIKPENMRIHNVPGEGKTVSGVAYYMAYGSETLQIINKHYNPYKDEITVDNTAFAPFTRAYKNPVIDIDGETFDKLK